MSLKPQLHARELGDACREFLAAVAPIEKANDPFWRRLHAIADKAEPELRKKILRAIADTASGVDGAALERALAAGNTEAALAAINWTGNGDAQLRAAYRTILGEVYQDSGQATATRLSRDLNVPATFDLAHPRAEAWAESVAATRVKDVSDATVDALRSYITRGYREAIHPRELARMIRGVKDPETGQYKQSLIGLTERQGQAVWNYRARLEEDENRPTGRKEEERIDRLVERYRDKLVLLRAETISRNETLKAASEGQRELWVQARENGSLRGDERRVWLDTGDARQCELCWDMVDRYGDDADGILLDQPYITPDGTPIMVPTDIHVECRCGEGLVEAASETGEEE